MRKNILTIRRLHYGFKKAGVGTVTSAADISLTTEDVLQSVVWDMKGEIPVALSVEEIDLKQVPLEAALKKLKARALKLHSARNAKVAECQYFYGGERRRS